MGILKDLIDTAFGVYDRAKEIPKTTKPGDILWFGAYEWLVLEVRRNRALLITKDIIGPEAYHNKLEAVTWEKCSLRGYLNEDFFNSDSFSDEERNKIARTTLPNPINPKFGTDGGAITRDHVFCLNIDEANQYFKNDNARKATYNGSGFWWWLRSPGTIQITAASVDIDGALDLTGIPVHSGSGGVRPALWIKL